MLKPVFCIIGHAGEVSSVTVLGGRGRLQSNKMCSAFRVAAPHAHEADVLSPHLCISAPNRPTPALRRFRVTHSFRGKSDPGGAVVSMVSSAV